MTCHPPVTSTTRLAERDWAADGLGWLRKQLQRSQPTKTDPGLPLRPPPPMPGKNPVYVIVRDAAEFGAQ